ALSFSAELGFRKRLFVWVLRRCAWSPIHAASLGRGLILAGPYQNLKGTNDLNEHPNLANRENTYAMLSRPFRNCKALNGLKRYEKMDHKSQTSQLCSAPSGPSADPTPGFQNFSKFPLATAHPDSRSADLVRPQSKSADKISIFVRPTYCREEK